MVVLFPGSPLFVIGIAGAMESTKLVTAGWLGADRHVTCVVKEPRDSVALQCCPAEPDPVLDTPPDPQHIDVGELERGVDRAVTRVRAAFGPRCEITHRIQRCVNEIAQAGKLSCTFAMLLEALNRHRGKGQQKMTVEHVHVHSGGQAVVGMVGTSGAGDNAKIEGQPHAAQIAYAAQPEMRCPQPQDRAAVPAAGDGERPLSHAWRTIDGGAEG
jgi:hypothetical protein